MTYKNKIFLALSIALLCAPSLFAQGRLNKADIPDLIQCSFRLVQAQEGDQLSVALVPQNDAKQFWQPWTREKVPLWSVRRAQADIAAGPPDVIDLMLRINPVPIAHRDQIMCDVTLIDQHAERPILSGSYLFYNPPRLMDPDSGKYLRMPTTNYTAHFYDCIELIYDQNPRLLTSMASNDSFVLELPSSSVLHTKPFLTQPAGTIIQKAEFFLEEIADGKVITWLVSGFQKRMQIYTYPYGGWYQKDVPLRLVGQAYAGIFNRKALEIRLLREWTQFYQRDNPIQCCKDSQLFYQGPLPTPQHAMSLGKELVEGYAKVRVKHTLPEGEEEFFDYASFKYSQEEAPEEHVKVYFKRQTDTQPRALEPVFQVMRDELALKVLKGSVQCLFQNPEGLVLRCVSAGLALMEKDQWTVLFKPTSVEYAPEDDEEATTAADHADLERGYHSDDEVQQRGSWRRKEEPSSGRVSPALKGSVRHAQEELFGDAFAGVAAFGREVGAAIHETAVGAASAVLGTDTTETLRALVRPIFNARQYVQEYKDQRTAATLERVGTALELRASLARKGLRAGGMSPMTAENAVEVGGLAMALTPGGQAGAAPSLAGTAGRILRAAGKAIRGTRVAPVTEAAASASRATKALDLATDTVKKSGRSGKQARLKDLASDDRLGSADRGWLQQELNSIERGSLRQSRTGELRPQRKMRVPPGKELAHRRGKAAKDGYGYEHSDLQGVDLHKLQHRHEGYS